MSDKLVVFGSPDCKHCHPFYLWLKDVCDMPIDYRDIQNGSGMESYVKDVLKLRGFPVTLKISSSGKIKKSLVGAPKDLNVIKKNLGV